jgi:hypothetical protein
LHGGSSPLSSLELLAAGEEAPVLPLEDEALNRCMATKLHATISYLKGLETMWHQNILRECCAIIMLNVMVFEY